MPGHCHRLVGPQVTTCYLEGAELQETAAFGREDYLAQEAGGEWGWPNSRLETVHRKGDSRTRATHEAQLRQGQAPPLL